MTADLPLLGAYVAKRCARRVHNDFDLTIPRAELAPLSPVLQARLDAGVAFEAEVFQRLRSVLDERCVEVSDVPRKEDQIAATVAAMDAGVEIILGGWLPDDPVGGRTGRPDLLIRVGDAVGSAGYVPGDVKGHRATKTNRSKSLRWSPLSDPAQVLTSDVQVAAAARFDDLVQLAHYSRMLDACGHRPGGDQRLGVVIGTDLFDDLDGPEPVLVWHDLDEPRFKTFSRSTPGHVAVRTAMERYDHEHAFRIKVAETARKRTGAPGDPEPLVVPIFQDECESCLWHDWCLDDLGSGVASVEITSGRLDRREWLTLNTLGVHTTEELAALDVTDEAWLDTYLPEVAHQSRARKRLDVAVQRALMVRDGVELRRTTTGPLAIPPADVEIDFDIEWDSDDRVYLWGTLLRHPGSDDATYRPFVTWDPITDNTEHDLADEFVTWLRTEITAADQNGHTLLVFHYANPEPRYLRKLLGHQNVSDVLDHFVDLLPLMRANFLGAHGLSIKTTAPAFGFAWRDEDPGGLQSQLWLDEARSTDDPTVAAALRQRILDYNEDDVAATAALRDGLRDSPLSK